MIQHIAILPWDGTFVINKKFVLEKCLMTQVIIKWLKIVYIHILVLLNHIKI